MTSKTFRELQHGDKINSPDGLNFIVHNNHQSASNGGIIVAVRTEVIYGRHCQDWSIVHKYPPVNLVMADGVYEVQVVRKI